MKQKSRLLDTEIISYAVLILSLLYFLAVLFFDEDNSEKDSNCYEERSQVQSSGPIPQLLLVAHYF